MTVHGPFVSVKVAHGVTVAYLLTSLADGRCFLTCRFGRLDEDPQLRPKWISRDASAQMSSYVTWHDHLTQIAENRLKILWTDLLSKNL